MSNLKVKEPYEKYKRQYWIEGESKTTGKHEDDYVCFSGYFGSYSPHTFAAAPELLEALEGMTEKYAELVNSGDCGFWDCENENEVKAARAAIKKAKGE